jgi:hypothetical protein
VINYDGKRFRGTAPGPDGDAPVASYHQNGDLVWAEFSGHDLRRGSLVGTCAADGTLEIAYCMVLVGGEVISGRSVSTPGRLADGRIRLHEQWERYGPHRASGVSYIEELSATDPVAQADPVPR